MKQLHYLLLLGPLLFASCQDAPTDVQMIENVEAATRFGIDHHSLHYVLFAITSKEDNKVSDVKSALTRMNRTLWEEHKLRVSNIYLGADNDKVTLPVYYKGKCVSKGPRINLGDYLPIMVIRKFENKDAAMEYYHTLLQKQTEYIPSDMVFDIYPITQNNYREVLKSKSLEGYSTFFKTYYLD